MSFCGDSERLEVAVFEGFNDQDGNAIQLRVKMVRTELMVFPAANKA
jgi:hypothetical protein